MVNFEVRSYERLYQATDCWYHHNISSFLISDGNIVKDVHLSIWQNFGSGL